MHSVQLVFVVAISPVESSLVYVYTQVLNTSIVQPASEESQTYSTLPQNTALWRKNFSVVTLGYAGPKIPTRNDRKPAVNRSLQVLKFSSYRSRSDEAHC